MVFLTDILTSCSRGRGRAAAGGLVHSDSWETSTGAPRGRAGIHVSFQTRRCCMRVQADWLNLTGEKLMALVCFLVRVKQQHLEERQADVEYELRCLLNKPGVHWWLLSKKNTIQVSVWLTLSHTQTCFLIPLFQNELANKSKLKKKKKKTHSEMVLMTWATKEVCIDFNL